MKYLKNNLFFSVMLTILMIFSVSCEDHLTDLNKNPLGIDPASGNPNQIMTTVLTGAARNYLDLGFGDVAGVMQHTQKDGWFSGHNHYDWQAQDWTGWYGLLRNNEYMIDRAEELGWSFHKGVGLVMRAFIFGTITDLWGDAPYTNALKGNTGDRDFLFPQFDPQETIYNGVISDLKEASNVLESASDLGVQASYDVIYGGNIEKWQKFANSLLLRYYMRVSGRMEAMARQGIEEIAGSGKLITSASDDATMAYLGVTASDSWPSNVSDGGSNFRRTKPSQTLLDALLENNDPRLNVWISPVHSQLVPDPTLDVTIEPFIRRNGEPMGVQTLSDVQYVAEKAAGNVFTRRYNPDSVNLRNRVVNNNMYVGLPPGILAPDAFNFNPTPGQNVQNQHVSQLSDIYREAKGDLLKSRLISAAEVHFILAEAALKGWSVGSAEMHYREGVRNSLTTWGVAGQFDDYIQQQGVVFDNTLERIMEQKWIASWTAAAESWFDFRRTGYPALEAGPASAQAVLPVRFNYGNDELNFNTSNITTAIERLEMTPFSGARGKDSQWSKPWILQGTNKPW
jgi:hypothetical protein